MKPVDRHLADILAVVRPLAPLEVEIEAALGAVLAEDVASPVPLPPFDNSAMDGYAVRAEDVAAAPVTLPVIGDVAAGDGGLNALGPGLVTRIMTGAPVPTGADAVVPVEWTDGGTARVRIDRPAPPGNAIRRAGEDVRAGDVVLREGVRIGPAQIGILAGVGRRRVLVRPRPRVVVLSTGAELSEPGTPLGAGRIWESNSFMLAAAVREAGAQGFRAGSVTDDPKEFMDTLDAQLVRADAVITSGGVSMGAYEPVKEALSPLGTVTFEKVAMQPGMPQGFGVVGPDRVPIFTLPGNPVSSFVSFVLFVKAGPAGDAGPSGRAARDRARGPHRAGAVPGGQAVVPAGRADGRERRTGDRAGLAPARGAGRGERADRGAGGRDLAARGRRGGGDTPVNDGTAKLTHVDESGAARMVDVSEKDVSARTSVATGRVLLSPEAVAVLRAGDVPKGDALGVARIAGIMGAKRTPDLVPLCHPIALTGVKVDLAVVDEGWRSPPGSVRPTGRASRWRRSRPSPSRRSHWWTWSRRWTRRP